ncbi:MAG: YbaN family protein [Bacteroidales bacterium]|nr:YbaN family protein [Bacteroidales bacterium]MDD4215461.1 YbaN family protein [Bacteroidales bacterium]
MRALLVVAGSFFTGLGILGIFLPLLPTTPFLLLAAACYARSSEKFYHRLLNNKWFGIYIKNYREGKGIPLKVKISAISLLWLTIVLSAIFATDNLFIRIILLVIATGVTLHIAFIRNKKS